ncbi:MAG: hypothetical protein H6509_04365 [Bryobacterales bacterium]|nr:hypothetical protein [Bryobacterales bacterium]
MRSSAAKKGGADYADVRISRYDNQGVFTRERQVQNIVSSSSYGYGVRVLKNGAWGFSASNDFRRDGASGSWRRRSRSPRRTRRSSRAPVRLSTPLQGLCGQVEVGVRD